MVYVEPSTVVEIAIDGLQASTRYPGGVALRFARVLRYRPDKSAGRGRHHRDGQAAQSRSRQLIEGRSPPLGTASGNASRTRSRGSTVGRIGSIRSEARRASRGSASTARTPTLSPPPTTASRRADLGQQDGRGHVGGLGVRLVGLVGAAAGVALLRPAAGLGLALDVGAADLGPDQGRPDEDADGVAAPADQDRPDPAVAADVLDQRRDGVRRPRGSGGKGIATSAAAPSAACRRRTDPRRPASTARAGRGTGRSSRPAARREPRPVASAGRVGRHVRQRRDRSVPEKDEPASCSMRIIGRRTFRRSRVRVTAVD